MNELREAILSNKDDFFSALENLSGAILILFDNEGKILDHSPSLISLVEKSDTLKGENICNLVVDNSQALLKRFGAKPVRIGLSDSRSNIHLVSGFVMLVDESRRLFLGVKIGLSAGDIMESMSKVTDELASLTRELARKNKELQAANKEIERLMNCDPLTGLSNRREFMNRLDKEIESLCSTCKPLSIIMADIDDFKEVNDTRGHPEGDRVLQLFAEILNEIISPRRTTVRYGGEEFIVMLPETTSEEATEIAEQVRKNFEEETEKKLGFTVTASFGVATFKPSDTKSSILKRVDDALYSAKSGGKNRVVH
ncbi:GGDEF domain-containing protein [Mesotoga prima]|uniref:GGDEF domain-containing protein n=1 Tax=Mesotoga prima TaxID=1184387 RepID=UPI002B7EFDC1|nr:GGDEF domain-containing protein [Mesotoga prima]HPA00385.1 GGDEF domain-containing protein [Mesotoga prima]